MGRPLNKKYFGNRNIGSTSTTADDGIGGQGVASITNATVGAIQINNTYKTFPALNVAAPTIANGVTALTAVTWEVATVSLSGGTGYTAGTITSITGLDGQAVTPTRFTVTQVGGVPTFNAFTDRGTYTSIDGTGITTWAIVGPGGTGAQATVTFRIKSIAITEKGSGYVSVPSLSWSAVNGGTMPSAQTPSLTVDTGAVGSSTYQENAIIAYAYISGALVEVDIQKQQSSKRYRVNKSGDTGVYEHVGTRMARLRSSGEADGTAGYTAEEGVELNIVAFDQAGGTYLVKKLTAHKAVVVPMAITRLSSSAGSQFPLVNGLAQTVPWTFATPTINYNVQIENA
jgi:hypothetical protein